MTSVNHRTCEICGLKERHVDKPVYFARFPINETRCREWVKWVGNEDLIHLPIEKLNQLKRVCERHFKKTDFRKKTGRLRQKAVPSKNLLLPPLLDEQMVGFPLHVSAYYIKGQPGTSRQPDGMNQPTPSTSSQFADGQNRPTQTGTLDSLPVYPNQLKEQDQQGSARPPPEEENQSAPVLQQPDSWQPELQGQPGIFRKPDGENQPTSGSSRQPAGLKQPTQTGVLDSLPIHADQLKQQDQQGSARLPPEEENQSAPVLQQPGSRQPEQIYLLGQPSTSRQPDGLNRPTNTRTLPSLPIHVDRLKQQDATPCTKKLLRQLRATKLKLASLKKSVKLINSLESPVLKQLVESALKNQKRKPQGKRYTTQQKISALAIFKRSPKGYRYLQKLITLPSVKTLQNVLKKIPMEPGISPCVIKHLKNVSVDRSLQNRVCVLCFDEMALKPRLVYNEGTDKVEGYQDLGDDPEGRSEALADHALVFLLQGIFEKFKQPIAFYFVKGTITSAKLSILIKKVIEAVTNTDFIILATVCDQGPTNMGALKILREADMSHSEQAIQNSFQVDGKKILIIYDVPHLFKSIRNNFWNYGEMLYDGKKASWAHLQLVEKQNTEQMLYLAKITPLHMTPTYRAKMKVKIAAQTLSNTVAAVLKLLGDAKIKSGDLEEGNKLKQSGVVVQEMDQLFDATNGPASKDDVKKGIRQNVTAKTNHLQVWANYRRKLSSVQFVKNGQLSKNVKCINGYQITLSSLQDLWHYVHDLGFKYLNLRQLNQDALENMFGLIRQHSPTNKNPTCSGFIGALKTSIISGMTGPQSRGSNCLKDDKNLMTNFHDLVFDASLENAHCSFESSQNHKTKTEQKQDAETIVTESEMIGMFHLEEDDFYEIEDDLLADVDKQATVYVSGYIAATIMKKSNDCHACKGALLARKEDLNSEIYAYIKLREWWPQKTSLTYPSIGLCKLVDHATKIFENEIISRLHEANISQLTVTIFSVSCDTAWFTCSHSKELLTKIYVRLGHLLIRRQCARINQKLTQKEEALASTCKKAQQQGIAK